jgi:hypothetical protein
MKFKVGDIVTLLESGYWVPSVIGSKVRITRICLTSAQPLYTASIVSCPPEAAEIWRKNSYTTFTETYEGEAAVALDEAYMAEELLKRYDEV